MRGSADKQMMPLCVDSKQIPAAFTTNDVFLRNVECRFLHGSSMELERESGKTGKYKKQAGCSDRHGLLG
jgi:hypothetical protein